MAQGTYWISEHDVVSVLDLGDAVGALRKGFAEEGTGTGSPMDKTMLAFGDHGTLHALGAALPGAGLVGTKAWAHTPGGADPALLLFDAGTGALVAVIEAFALGQLRTSGTAALATDLLARPDASVLAVVGTGRQALPQVAAVAHVRPLTEVRAYSPTPAHREGLARRVADELGLECRPAASVAEAVAGADVVTLVTRATAPVFTEDMVEPGMHVNAVGAIDLARCEFDPPILRRCATVATDSLAQARRLSSELRQFFADDERAWARLVSLGALVAAPGAARTPGDVTLFKGMGSGIEDLALGAEVLRRIGTRAQTIERRGKAPASLRPATTSDRAAR